MKEQKNAIDIFNGIIKQTPYDVWRPTLDGIAHDLLIDLVDDIQQDLTNDE